MATQTVKYIIDLIAGILQDEDFDHWTETEHIKNYNLSVIDIIRINPEARAVTKSVLLSDGSRHTLPANAMRLLDVISNMGTDGETEGDAVTRSDIMSMEAFDRSWRTATAQETIYNFMFDPDDPKAFYSYPQANGTGYVSARYSEVPDQVVYDSGGNWEAAPVAVLDDFVDALIKKMLDYAYKKDSDFPGNKDRENDSGSEYMQDMALSNQ